MSERRPLWKLDMYKGFESLPYKDDLRRMTESTAALNEVIENDTLWKDFPIEALENTIPLINEAYSLYENLGSYTYCRYSTKTDDAQSTGELNSLEELALPRENI